MKRDAEAHAAEDKARRELVDLKNKGDAMVIQSRKALEEHGGKVTSEVRARLESAISSLETKLKADDRAAIEAAMKELEAASMEIGKVMYEAAKQQPGGTESSTTEPKPQGAGKDDVIDAEFKVKE